MFDEDMKIAGSKPSLSVRQSAEADTVSAELDQTKRAGELEKAHALGKLLAD